MLSHSAGRPGQGGQSMTPGKAALRRCWLKAVTPNGWAVCLSQKEVGCLWYFQVCRGHPKAFCFPTSYPGDPPTSTFLIVSLTQNPSQANRLFFTQFYILAPWSSTLKEFSSWMLARAYRSSVGCNPLASLTLHTESSACDRHSDPEGNPCSSQGQASARCSRRLGVLALPVGLEMGHFSKLGRSTGSWGVKIFIIAHLPPSHPGPDLGMRDLPLLGA